VLACVVIDDTRIAAHQVVLAEHVAAKTCRDGVCDQECKTIDSRIEVPEVAHASAAGEWLVPNDSSLVVSLGAQTTADEQGKAVVVERLVLIEARPVTDASVNETAMTQPFSLVAPNRPVSTARDLAPAGQPGGTKPMAMPSVPSRSLPQALAADGSPVELPPLPDDASTPASTSGSAEPCASPQALHPRNGSKSIDSASTQVSFTPASKEKDKEKDKEKEKATEVDATRSARPCLLRIPITAGGMNLEVEVRATLPILGGTKSPANEP
jgi:hypothetical protein